MAFTFSSAKDIVDKRKLYYSIRVSITIIIVAVIYSRVRVQLDGFSNSVACAAATVLPSTGLYVGETLNKAIINIVANILGMLLGYGLRMFSEYEIGKAKFAFLLPVVFTLIVLVTHLSFVKVVKDWYDWGMTAFLQVTLVATLHLWGPDWLTNEFLKNAATLGIAYALTIISSFLPPFWAGVDVHNGIQEYLDTLAGIFKGLGEECFGENCMYENLQDKSFLQPLQYLSDSKEKENSLSKFVSWELLWRHLQLQEQYEKIGDLSRRCASTIQSLSTFLTTKYSTENLQFSTQLRETWREMCAENANALARLSLSMKQKTAPAASTYIHVKAALDLASHLYSENTLEAKEITSRLVEHVMIIKELLRLMEEQAELLTRLGSLQRYFLSNY